jgi:hypothetical protein
MNPAMRGSWMLEAFNAGDEIIITCLGKTVEGTIQSIIPTQKAAVLVFAPGALRVGQYDGYEGRVMVIMDEKGVYRSIVDGITVVFKKKLLH